MKKRTVAFATSLALLLTTASAFAFESFVGPTGLFTYNREKAYNGYTLFAPNTSTTTYLIDMEGNLVHSWPSKYTPGYHAVLLENGNLLRGASLPKPPSGIGGGGGMLQEIDWDGNVVWEYRMMDDNTLQHHTFDRMPNGNTLLLAWERKTNDEMRALGRTLNFVPEEGIDLWGDVTKDFWVDFIREVNPKGETVWEWHAIDHIGKGPDKLDINYVMPHPVGGGAQGYDTTDWTHFNTCQYVADGNKIVTNSRNMGEVFVIDRATGKIESRWGNPSAYGAGKAPSYYDNGDQILFGSHAASMQPNGNIVVFNNGSEAPERRVSSIYEFDPKTGKIVWEFAPKMVNSFYSDRQGAVEKLPNGNYLVTSTHNGHLFEVTPEKEIVWEYFSPVFGKRIACVTRDSDVLGKDILANFIHRAYRYGPDYPGLKGRDLGKKLPFAEKCPSVMEFFQAGDAAYPAPVKK